MRSDAVVTLACLLAAASGLRGQTPVPTAEPPLLARLCGECHTGDEAERGFRIETVWADDGAEAALSALARLRSRTMPPPEAAQPTEAERRELQTVLAARVPAGPDALTPALRRLARPEYERAVRALFGIEVRLGDLLPEDAPTYGFDNLGDGAGISALLFEKYLDAAGAVAARVVADPAAVAVVHRADEPPARTMTRLLDAAFRRPAAAAEVDARLRLYAAEAARAGRDAAIAAVVRSVLISPSFVFRVEADRTDGELSDHELAVRLSFLLAGAPPDGELRELADSGRLRDPATLRRQAERLLQADGANTLARRFAAQWLRFDDVLTHNADFRRYPQIWNQGLRPAFYEQAVRFVAAIAAENRSALELLDSDWTIVNGTLRKHYGLGGDERADWARISLDDRSRGGMLGMGAMLMSTSYPLRTSPVLRGKWILERLLDAPPPPPPPGAGTLPADDELPDKVTFRARLERHRRDRACASCHAQIDPLGFALDNYDVLGRWRDAVQDAPIDATAELPDGTAVRGPLGLRIALLVRRDDFVRALTKNLLTYAIGRPIVPADEPELQRIAALVAADGYRFGTLLGAVVTSPLFVRRGPLPTKPIR
ncbi:MAG: hypothetical protein RL398_1645 [Planctomycetota bacterium]